MVKFKPGDVICKSDAIVHVVTTKEKHKICDFCLKSPIAKLQKCSQCHEMSYCSRECQRNDWLSAHKYNECKILRKTEGKTCQQLDTDFYRLLLRFVLKANRDPDLIKRSFKLFDGRDRFIEDIMDHVNEMKETPIKLLPLQLAARHMISLGVRVDEDTIIRRAHQLFVNAFGIFDENVNRKMNATGYEVGLGLFVEGSIFDHSCHPNAAQVYEGTTMYVRALRDIDSEQEIIFISYTDLMQVRQVRQVKLKEIYYFDCNCSKCLNETEDDLYQEFQALKEQFKVFDQSDRCEEAHQTVIKMVPIVSKVLGQYSVWGTEALWLCVQFGLLALKEKNDQIIPQQVLDDWLKFKDAVTVTHGKEHTLYKSSVESELGDMFDKQVSER